MQWVDHQLLTIVYLHGQRCLLQSHHQEDSFVLQQLIGNDHRKDSSLLLLADLGLQRDDLLILICSHEVIWAFERGEVVRCCLLLLGQVLMIMLVLFYLELQCFTWLPREGIPTLNNQVYSAPYIHGLTKPLTLHLDPRESFIHRDFASKNQLVIWFLIRHIFQWRQRLDCGAMSAICLKFPLILGFRLLSFSNLPF